MCKVSLWLIALSKVTQVVMNGDHSHVWLGMPHFLSETTHLRAWKTAGNQGAVFIDCREEGEQGHLIFLHQCNLFIKM